MTFIEALFQVKNDRKNLVLRQKEWGKSYFLTLRDDDHLYHNNGSIFEKLIYSQDNTWEVVKRPKEYFTFDVAFRLMRFEERIMTIEGFSLCYRIVDGDIQQLDYFGNVINENVVSMPSYYLMSDRWFIYK